MKRIIFASKNKGKILEVRHILNDCNIELLSLLDYDGFPDIIESGVTFEENAKIKAEAVYNHFRIPAIADDSGIEVKQLGWKPGVYSARYAGENATDDDNNKKLINEISRFPEPHHARYFCCAVYFDGYKMNPAFGEIKGRIIFTPRGTNGFGYDPYFVADDYDVTMAELPPEIKNSISHRFRAFNEIKKFLK
ncbi:MAG: RdgB/HAM1 family non-canonical purine NTP pyrophosphatase [Ignavibacteriales bacterium]|nr:MAG: RdgB/HAM1 family non-canonical purine NTP pyrophosphatase [Ignavibacteriales bacterium]